MCLLHFGSQSATLSLSPALSFYTQYFASDLCKNKMGITICFIEKFHLQIAKMPTFFQMLAF